MKKLKGAKFTGAEVLTRDQLRKVIGGDTGSIDPPAGPLEGCPPGMYECFCSNIFRGCVFGANQCWFICNP